MPITDISIGPKSVEQSIQADCIGKIFLKHPGMLRCRRGVLLITIEGDALDYQLTEGSELLLPSRRLCLVEGGGTFVLGLEPRGCRESIKKMKNSILPSGKGLIPTQGNALVVLLITLLFVASQANLVLILTQLHPSYLFDTALIHGRCLLACHRTVGSFGPGNLSITFFIRQRSPVHLRCVWLFGGFQNQLVRQHEACALSAHPTHASGRRFV